jgi:hypothetical protein
MEHSFGGTEESHEETQPEYIVPEQKIQILISRARIRGATGSL